MIKTTPFEMVFIIRETMKTYICTFLILLLCIGCIFPITAEAASPRILSISPFLSFSGTTAECDVMVNADNTTDRISAVIILWEGNTGIKQWRVSDVGHLAFYDTYSPCTSGESHVLTVDVTLNGVLQQRISSRPKTCP